MDFYIGNSEIHGKGLFTKKVINPLNVLPIANLYDKNNRFKADKTGKSVGPMGFVNHSYNPNCHLHYLQAEHGYFLRAHKRINPKSELTVNYDLNPDGLKKAYEYNPPLK